MGFNRLSDWWHGRHDKVVFRHLGAGTQLIVLLLLMLAGVRTVYAKYGGGTGTRESPYIIVTPADLALIGYSPDDWDKHFKLIFDVDMRDYNGVGGRYSLETIGYLHWQPYESRPFRGTFDGNGKRIMNLQITRTGQDFVGLFGYVRSTGLCIKDLKIINPKITAGAGAYVGAVVGKLRDGSIFGCSVEGGSISGGDCTGGLVGNNMGGMISKCDVAAAVTGNTDVGGVAGYHASSVISWCSFTGKVVGRNDVGGLVGESDGNIEYCFAEGNVYAVQDKAAGLVGTLRGRVYASFARGRVKGNNEVGGLIGRNIGQAQDSYSQGIVSGNYYVGGLAGLLYGGGTVSRSYAACEVDVNEGPAGMFIGVVDDGTVSASFWTPGGTPNEAMLRQSTYTTAGWDFVGESVNGRSNLWEICEGTDYPRLTWEKVPEGDFVCPEGVDIYDIEILSEQWLAKPVSVDITGNGLANFQDLAAFAGAWKSTTGSAKWDARCDVSPEGGDGVVNIDDIMVLFDRWLGTGAGLGDIAPSAKPDGIVNLLDFAVAAKNFLNAD